MQRTELRPGRSISRIVKGGWHLAGGHGDIDHDQAVRDMATFVEAGITTFDVADIYTGVEDLIGAFRRDYPSLADSININSKFVPDFDSIGQVDEAYVETMIQKSLKRLGKEQLDMAQFHWWDTDVPGYVDFAMNMKKMQDKGLIGLLGVTNFNTAALRKLVDAGYPLVTNHIQYSVLDRRPEQQMIDFCADQDAHLFCYGALAGGFLTDDWLGQPEPTGMFSNRSLTKYKLIIDDFGGWDLFQQLLGALRAVADRHEASIGQIAVAWNLSRPQVGCAVVGATSTRHLDENLHILDIQLSDQDFADIDAVSDRATGPAGDVYDLERDKQGRHGSIMHYNLNDGRV
ncbi:MAG: aldo/keto reductase [Alphaproteobacteria bacterium]|jgi:aryl-alcohol dehydrogenase-like predicted oxidoreductase|nr:aldo/keto reductase [Alphaproteobacteria bacterium]MBT4084631.1 aldo/keto reductase [Alphaproteobacteria bacterium]MBT4543607.1 aldo/keto reductase [Alphaproteobacteria bacterium]MBT6386345.1 aldo/keto reductase [Alphaproteobacteria bacterium]MBT7743770.1 aldo/keto reductase [Alphaproteobacteria bacterium]